jgi:trk system potassium uptake protein TrkH
VPADVYSTLAYAVRAKAVLKYQGELCVSLVGIAVVPAAYAALVGDWGFAFRAALPAVALAGAGLVLSRLRGPRELQSNEALVVISLGYMVTALLMTWPLAGDGVPALDAFFHAVSAITTTGLSTLDSVESRSPAFLFTQAWMQWYGGLVIVVLAVFLVGPGTAAKRLAAGEVDDTGFLSGTRARASYALMVYTALTAGGVLLLWLMGAELPEAALHALSAVSTGGFSSHDDSLQGLNGWPLQACVMILAVAGAISFARYQGILRRGRGEGRTGQGFWDTEIFALLTAFVLVAVLVGLSLGIAGAMSWGDILLSAPLLAVSAQTTAGFSPVEVASLDAGSKAVLILSMLVGGDVGSTAGGIKIFRLLLILRLVQLALLRPALPSHAVVRPELNGRPLEEADIQGAVGVVALYLLVVLVSWLAFVAYGYPAIDALFEVVSASGTVGLSTGLAGPDLPGVLKGVLCLDMWMGRLEVLAVLILFHPRSWLGRRAEIR